MNTPSLNLANENWQRVVDHDQRLTDHESIDLSFDLESLDFLIYWFLVHTKSVRNLLSRSETNRHFVFQFSPLLGNHHSSLNGKSTSLIIQ